jgi:hypothetical protein
MTCDPRHVSNQVLSEPGAPVVSFREASVSTATTCASFIASAPTSDKLEPFQKNRNEMFVHGSASGCDGSLRRQRCPCAATPPSPPLGSYFSKLAIPMTGTGLFGPFVFHSLSLCVFTGVLVLVMERVAKCQVRIPHVSSAAPPPHPNQPHV